jgi:hypothetical protein
MTSKIFVAAALAVASLAGTTCASKADVNYVLNATFDDGTPLTGKFNVDVYGYVDSFNLTSIGSGPVPGYVYTGGPTATEIMTLCMFSRSVALPPFQPIGRDKLHQERAD